MARRPRNADQIKYGIAEWYGRLYRKMGATERNSLLAPNPIPDCPFLRDVPDLAPNGRMKCSKPGGVCSIRNFALEDDGQVRFGPITATCPNRFLQARTAISSIGFEVLDTEKPLVAKEIAFLQRVSAGPVLGDATEAAQPAAADPSADTEDVGKIDLVFVHPDKEPLDWCAVEMQAVYFSGGAMSKDFESIRTYQGNGTPMPGAVRRPDFRSSGPKRLMPQLQIKVPSLRRWGKKMIVIVDRPFIDAMAPMEKIGDISNSDIVWAVVNYKEEEGQEVATLVVEEFVMTTLEAAVVGLTAGVPTTLREFEAKLKQKVAAQKLMAMT